MKSMFIFILLIIFNNPIFSQEKKEVIKGDELIIVIPEKGKVENGVYTCNLFDWKIEIPQGYVITDFKRIEELEKNAGKELIEVQSKKDIAEKTYDSANKELIALQCQKDVKT